MCWHGSASGKRGCSPKYSEAAIQFCLTIKGLFNLPLRQAMVMSQSLLKLAGLNWQVPDFSTVSRRQKHLAVTIGAQPTTTGLHLLVDSTGIQMLSEGEWKAKWYGADYRRQWRKVHLGIDATALEIRAIEVTDNATGDAPMLPCLLNQVADDEAIASVSGDGAYDTKGCHETIASEVRKRSSQRAKMLSHGKIRAPAPQRGMPSSMPRAGLAGKLGRSGLVIIDAAWLKPKCVASSCSVNASWRVTSTVRSPNCRYVPQSLIASRYWGRLLRWLCHKSVWGSGDYAPKVFMQQSLSTIDEIKTEMVS